MGSNARRVRVVAAVLLLGAAIAAGSAAVPAMAEDLSPRAGERGGPPLAIRAGKILTVTNGVINNGLILVEDGIIRELGPDVDVPDDAVVIEVTGEQFTWNVRYPGEDGEFGRTDPHRISVENPLGVDSNDPAAADDIHELAVFYVPVNRPVHIRLRSKDVLHSFYLPHHRIKQDAVPGMTIGLWFVPTVEGEFELACAELCGFGHYQMRGTFHVVSEQEFEQWLSEKRAAL